MSDRGKSGSRNVESGQDTAARPTVLETIANGFSLLVARPYLLVLPVVVDLLTWLGIQVSARSLTTPLQRSMSDQGGENGPVVAEQIGELGERLRVNDVVTWLVPSIFGGLPKDSILNGLVLLLVPGLTTGVDRTVFPDDLGDGLGRLWEPVSAVAVVGFGVLMFGLATVITVIFRVSIARAVRRDELSGTSWIHEAMVAWGRLLLLIAIVITFAIAVVVPLVLVTAMFAVLGINMIALLSLIVFLFGGLVAIYTLFVFDAMLISRVGPIRGLVQSFAIVRANFSQTVRFAAVYLLIATGILRVWQSTVEQVPGLVIALAGNALIGTALTTASMMFFFDRMAGMPAGFDRPPRFLRRILGTDQS